MVETEHAADLPHRARPLVQLVIEHVEYAAAQE